MRESSGRRREIVRLTVAEAVRDATLDYVVAELVDVRKRLEAMKEATSNSR